MEQRGSTVLYLAGPMTGIPEYNFPAFAAARNALRAAGFVVYCPAESDIWNGFDPRKDKWTPKLGRAAMQRNLTFITDADGIALLTDNPMWLQSRGLIPELALAAYLGLPVMAPDAWIGAAVPAENGGAS